ncbi:MAG: hypothetical protein AVDCRST_MAG03-84 [uncultured Rubrobacteraceae bacterium]|uniref:Uncharacterized protein n=1 Tax=uncultured Rubrobacteraceae bacterium TaxID=349277 RepID=A0A6J4NAM2_9ACTN|nr:MAG: hypothetical protein AVDCRST_MAG03-84 [uncultured Rubrobacteraceae bacterium]
MITSSFEVPLIESPAAVPESVAARATPESAASRIATTITIVAVRLIVSTLRSWPRPTGLLCN